MDEQEFVSLLQALLQPDTQKVKAATSKLNKTYYTSPNSIVALIHITTSHSEPDLRQLASVELRKLVPKHWAKVDESQKPQLRESLLRSTIDEEKALPRHSKAWCVASIAQKDLEDGQWEELPGLLQRAATSDNVTQREVGLYIIYTLLETMPDMFQENMSNMLTLFTRTIQDPDSVEVRVNTMMALAEIGMVLDTDEDIKNLKAFQATIPHMVQVLQSTIQAQDDEHSMKAFDVFNKLLSYESAFLNVHFGDLIQFFMRITANSELDEDVRIQAISFLMQSVRYRKMKVQSLKVGEQMTSMCVQVATELEEVPDEDDDMSPARSALNLLDIMSESLPPSQVAVPLLKIIGPYVQNPDPKFRRAGILALGMCVEGAPDFIATQLPEILPLVLHLLEDSSASVRSAALHAASRLADDLAEDMGKEHARLIPALVKNFDLALAGIRSSAAESEERELNLSILKGSCVAVDALIEGLEAENAARYVEELVPRFATLFDDDGHQVQMAAVGAVGSIASASEAAFKPYFEITMQSLGKYIAVKDSDDQLELRSVVVDSLGKIASAVGPEAFQPYVNTLMQSSEEGLNLGHQRLKETSFVLWSTLARVYEEKFDPFLNGVATSLLACLEQDEADAEVQLGEEASDLIGKEVTIAGKKIRVAGAGGADEDDEDLSAILGDMDDDDFEDLGAVTGIAMEKEIAVEVVGDVLAHTKGKYLPYMEKTIALILPLLDHSFEGVRKGAVSTMWRAYACLWGLAEDNGMQKWEPGLPLKVKPTADLEKFGDLVMQGTLALWEEEMDRATVTEINRTLAATLRLCGPAVLAPSTSTPSRPVEKITALILQILQKQHPCQKDDDDFDDSEVPDVESSEYDWLTIETAMETVTAMAAALGSQSAELWKIFETPIMKYTSSQERFERSAAIGTIADCIDSMGEGCTPFTPRLMRVLLKRLSDDDADTKSNAAFGLGLLCANSTDGKEIVGNYNKILGTLEPLLVGQPDGSKDSTQARLRDNAAGCLARMIKKAPQSVPLDDVLPRLVEILPLKEDFRENEPVFDMIVGLYQSQHAIMQSLTDRLMPVFQKVLGPPDDQLTDESRIKVQELVKYLVNGQ